MMEPLKECIRLLSHGTDLPQDLMRRAMTQILEGKASASELAAWAMGLRVKGETADEISGAAAAMRSQCTSVSFGSPLLDTCGTGGDGAETFNISTASALVLAACGQRIAKHGNRAVSSKAGSADVLEALGIPLSLSEKSLQRCMEEVGIAFLFAPDHHQALKHAAPVRKELGIRTIFNLLGPLANPAQASHQLMGVFDPTRLPSMAAALGSLGVTRAWVVHGAGGLDEVSPCGVTNVSQWDQGGLTHFDVTPSDFGESEVPVEALTGGDAIHNARIIESILSGEERGPKRSVVVINAAAGLHVACPELSLAECADRVRACLDGPDAMQTLLRFKEVASDGSA